MSVALVTVAAGEVYERYAQDLMESARRLWRPSGARYWQVIRRPGLPWPYGTLLRYHWLLESRLLHDPDVSYIYLCDADMLIEEPIGDEILGDLVATQHPGFVGRRVPQLPYERRLESAAGVRLDEGTQYFCGGFVGGEREEVLRLATTVSAMISRDSEWRTIAIWHDESYLNRALINTPPTLVLSPSYCHPADDRPYRDFWPEMYERKILALDKPQSERVGR